MNLPASDRGAAFSPCGRYRYGLWRRWGAGQAALFIGLNPSTADAEIDDPTVRRCMRFARDWGYAGLLVANLFGLRSTDPRGLRGLRDPIGPDNDAWIARYQEQAGLVVAAWGAGGALNGRDRAVLAMLKTPRCLGKTKAGAPRHPLYIAASTRPRAYAAPRA